MSPGPRAVSRRLDRRRGVAIALLCWIGLSGLYLLGAFRDFDLGLLDVRFRLRGERAASDKISLILVDDRTIDRYQTWPLPREQYALLIDALAEGGASAVGMDLVFLNRVEPGGDSLLAITSRHNGSVVHAMVAETVRPTRGSTSEPKAGTSGGEGLPIPNFAATRAGLVALPYAELTSSAAALAHVAVLSDPDGGIRRVPPFIRFGNQILPALAISVLSVAEEDSLPEWTATRGGIHLRWNNGRGAFLPLDRDGGTAIDFAGIEGAFRRRYSMVDVCRWYADGDRRSLQRAFGNRMVLVGATGTTQLAADVGPTPFGPNTPLVYVHANLLQSLLEDRFLTRPPAGVVLGFLLVVLLVLSAFFLSLSQPWSIALLAGTVLGYAGLDYGLFSLHGVVLPSTLGLVAPPLLFLAIETDRARRSERREREREEELAIAAEIQQRLLPRQAPQVFGLDTFGINIPVRQVRADYFDWIPRGDGSLSLSVADVPGTGVPAALLTVHLHASLHFEIGRHETTAAVVEAMHVSLFRAVQSKQFATLFLAWIDPAKKLLRFCNAGHHPGLLVRSGRVELLEATGLPLGMIQDGPPYVEETRALEPGDVLVLHSDGITSRPWGNRYYPPERLATLVADVSGPAMTAHDIGNAILGDLYAFAHGVHAADDVTLLVVRIEAEDQELTAEE